jgi:hypothetical protein
MYELYDDAHMTRFSFERLVPLLSIISAACTGFRLFVEFSHFCTGRVRSCFRSVTDSLSLAKIYESRRSKLAVSWRYRHVQDG